jgi:bacterial/archaeal transporter family-2 protein
MSKFVWIIIAFVAGAVLPIQAGFNFRLGKSIYSPVYASMISFLVGMISVGLYGPATTQGLSLNELKTAPPYVWLGGILGGFYVTAVILTFPRLGPSLTFGLVVAGQMLVSIVLDHFNILVTQPHPINVWRVVGIMLVIAGVIVIRKF